MVNNLANPQHRYLKTQIETASQPQLLVMLFDGAVKKLHLSKKAIAEKNIEKSHTELTKVQKIFTELMIALDFEKGGDIASNLLRIYDFIYHYLVRANIKQDSSLIDEVLPIVESLRDGWTQAVDKYVKEEGETESTPSEPASRTMSFDSKQSQPTPARKIPTIPASSNYSEEEPRPRLNIRG